MSYAIPVFIIVIISFSLFKKTPVYDGFLSGAREGIETLSGIFPALLGIMVATSMLRASGALEAFAGIFAPLTERMGINEDILLLGMMRPLSGGGSLGILSDILSKYGADSFSGLLASVMMGSTETTFYTLTVYFAKTNVKHSKRVIPAAVFGDVVGLLASWAVCRVFFG